MRIDAGQHGRLQEGAGRGGGEADLMTRAWPWGTSLQKPEISRLQAVFMGIWKSMDSAMSTSSSNSWAEHCADRSCRLHRHTHQHVRRASGTCPIPDVRPMLGLLLYDV